MHEKPNVISESLLFKRHLKLWNRTVKYPNTNQTVDWDVVGHTTTQYPTFCTIFPFFTGDKTTMLVQEYAQGPDELMYTLAAGAFDPKKHVDLYDCARAELREELRLDINTDLDVSTTLIKLLPDGHEGVPELKWGTNRFCPLIALDPRVLPENAHVDQDAEEFFLKPERMTLQQVDALILEGRVMLPSVQTILMARHKLKELNMLL